MNDGSDDVIADLAQKKGRGRPHKPPIPPPPWPVITGEMELLHDAFKRGGEAAPVEIGRLPARPATFIYRRP